MASLDNIVGQHRWVPRNGTAFPLVKVGIAGSSANQPANAWIFPAKVLRSFPCADSAVLMVPGAHHHRDQFIELGGCTDQGAHVA